MFYYGKGSSKVSCTCLKPTELSRFKVPRLVSVSALQSCSDENLNKGMKELPEKILQGMTDANAIVLVCCGIMSFVKFCVELPVLI